MGVDNQFGFEIDFLPVGEGAKSGDAICLRWGHLGKPDEQNVMVVDGGFAENAKDIVKHLRHYYNTATIDYAVVSHPHADHMNGIKAMLEDETNRVSIDALLMINPMGHIKIDEFNAKSLKVSSVRRRLESDLSTAKEILELAKKNKISHYEPFADWDEVDLGFGVRMRVLNPTKGYYEELLASFTSTPTNGDRDGSGRLQYTGGHIDARKATLTDEGETSAENDASIVLCLTLPSGEIILLTGDAGIDALNRSVRKAIKCGINLPQNIRIFKVPHHGSIQNLGETVLNGIVGDPKISESRSKAYAMIMVSKNPAKGHPDKTVTNALWERNCEPYKTGGNIRCYSIGKCPDRGWAPAKSIEYYPEVDEVR